MRSGAAGEVDQAGGASDMSGEAQVDAGGNQDGVLKAVESLPGVVDLGEGAVRRRPVSRFCIAGDQPP